MLRQRQSSTIFNLFTVFYQIEKKNKDAANPNPEK